MASVAISMRRRGITRLARRKFDLRLAFFGSIYLLHLPMKSASAQKRIVLLLFQPPRCVQAFFVARADVTGNRFTLRLRLRAFKSDDSRGMTANPSNL